MLRAKCRLQPSRCHESDAQISDPSFVGGKQESISGRHLNGARLQDIETPSLLSRSCAFPSMCIVNYETVRRYTRDLRLFVLRNGLDRPVKPQWASWEMAL